MPVPFKDKNGGTIQIRTDNAPHNLTSIPEQVKALQEMTTVSPLRQLRRLLFVWLRIFVYESKRGKGEKVNISIPLAIPLVGTMFAREISWQQAVQLVTSRELAEDPTLLKTYLESCMGLELMRVEDEKPERGTKELVVIGLD
jgi:hypothetical protein